MHAPATISNPARTHPNDLDMRLSPGRTVRPIADPSVTTREMKFTSLCRRGSVASSPTIRVRHSSGTGTAATTAGALPPGSRADYNRMPTVVPALPSRGGLVRCAWGGVPEWTKGADCKSAIRGFESPRRLSKTRLRLLSSRFSTLPLSMRLTGSFALPKGRHDRRARCTDCVACFSVLPLSNKA